jgi:ribosomal protein S18 acetylase RimI-like enzyme
MTIPDRAALEHQNWIAYLTGVGGFSAEIESRRVGGAVAIRSSIPFDWFNQVLVERDDATASDLLEAARRGAGTATGPVVRLRDSIDDRFVPELAKAGWVRAGAETMTPGMVAHPIDHLASGDTVRRGFEIRRVTDAAGIELHRHVVTEGFGSAASVAIETTGFGLLGATECSVYVGFAGGLPVTSGMGWRTGRTIGVYAIATVPAARRRGYGEAMTARVVADGIAAGCDVAVLQASVAGRPIYERLGFRVDVRYDTWVTPAGTGSAAD